MESFIPKDKYLTEYRLLKSRSLVLHSMQCRMYEIEALRTQKQVEFEPIKAFVLELC